MEILWIRFPYGDNDFNTTIWSEADEQRIDEHVRRNGFRAGVHGGNLPSAIAQVIATPSDDSDPQVALELAPGRARRRTVQLAHGQHCEVQASPVHAESSWLKSDADGIRGDSFPQAQCIYRARVSIERGQLATVELTPEIQFGAPQRRFSTKNDGVVQLLSARDRKVFDDLRMTARLAAGEMLIVTSLPHLSGSLGQRFDVLRPRFFCRYREGILLHMEKHSQSKNIIAKLELPEQFSQVWRHIT